MTNDSLENPSEDLEAPGDTEGQEEGAGTPAQLGLQRFVFAAYFALAILVAFVYPETAHRKLEELNPEDSGLERR